MNKDIEINYSTSSRPGGQRRDKKKTAVILHYLPSNIIIRIDEQRLQSQNKKIALRILAEKLRKLRSRKKKRIPTRIPKNVKEKRLQIKKQNSRKKKLRRVSSRFL